MTIFVILYIYLLSIWGLSLGIRERNRHIFICICSCLAIWLIQALRDFTIGTDVENYINAFSKAELIGDENQTEIGFLKFNYFIHKYLTDSGQAYLAVVSGIFILSYSIVVYKFSQVPSLSYVILVSFVIYIFSFSALRQICAMSITTFSFIYIYKKNLLSFLICTALASLFHSSAIIFIIAYPLCNYVKLTKSFYIYSFIIIACSISYFKQIITFAITLIFAESQYDSYLEANSAPAYNLAILIFLFFLFTFLNKNPTRLDKQMQLMLFLSFSFQCLGLISPVIPRLGFYFFIFISIALSNITIGFSNLKTSQHISQMAISSFMIWFFFRTYSNGYLNVIPYKFMWE